MSSPFIAQITMFGGTFNPRGWANCDGQLLPINQNQALFSLLGTIYGGDGRTTFGLPDLRGRFPMHLGQGPGLTNRLQGQRSGAENHTLTKAQMPAHRHTVACNPGGTGIPNSDTPQGNFPSPIQGELEAFATEGATPMNANMLSEEGNNQQFSLMNPFLVIRFIIALQGVFPSRN